MVEYVVAFEKQGYLNNLIRALVTKLPKRRGEGEEWKSHILISAFSAGEIKHRETLKTQDSANFTDPYVSRLGERGMCQ